MPGYAPDGDQNHEDQRVREQPGRARITMSSTLVTANSPIAWPSSWVIAHLRLDEFVREAACSRRTVDLLLENSSSYPPPYRGDKKAAPDDRDGARSVLFCFTDHASATRVIRWQIRHLFKGGAMAEFFLVVIALVVGLVVGGLAMYQRGFASGRREAKTAFREVIVDNQEEGGTKP